METPKSLLICTCAPAYHAILKKLTARERHVVRDEAYILAGFKDMPGDIQLILREPGKPGFSVKSATRRAIELFQPQSALLLDMMEENDAYYPGEVITVSGENPGAALAELHGVPPGEPALGGMAEAFFEALHTTPGVYGMGIVGIKSRPDEQEETPPDPDGPVETMALEVLNVWRLINGG